MTYREAGKIAMLLRRITGASRCGIGATEETAHAGIEAVEILLDEFPEIREMSDLLDKDENDDRLTPKPEGGE